MNTIASTAVQIRICEKGSAKDGTAEIEVEAISASVDGAVNDVLNAMASVVAKARPDLLVKYPPVLPSAPTPAPVAAPTTETPAPPTPTEEKGDAGTAPSIPTSSSAGKIKTVSAIPS